MALYLGNQKVSLRSGQDPTFDYGFDSNGRLVFANKNATEINNFLNYDSSYSEILDLSNLSKMEKVAVNGTADRKMEGLKGLLVSPNAPFTGASPQINASYTGLSKSALVSLFESAPYNVGYTKVGNPIIVDGIASGFSSNGNYLQLNNSEVSSINSFKVAIKLTTPSESWSKEQTIIGYQSQPTGLSNLHSMFLLKGDGKPSCILFRKRNNSTKAYTLDIDLRTRLNETFTFKAKTDMANVWLYLYDANGNLVETKTYTSQDLVGQIKSGVLIGLRTYDREMPFLGYIDLNNTYIKVNEVPWFTGKEAMTKTCSIVGATGTADLTQEDKNIILNKGWSLTVQ